MTSASRPEHAVALFPTLDMRLVGRSLLDLVDPPLCGACGETAGEPHALCPACWGGLRLIERPYCERLGTPFAVDDGVPLLSPAAIADPPVFGRCRSVALHEGAARDLCHRLKYQDRTELAVAMGRLMARAGRELLSEADVLCPVPLHWTRAFSRRFNQSAALAAVISRESALPNEPGLVVRRKRTRQQVGLTKPERRDNLQGAFRVPDGMRPSVLGRRIVLIDDVLTTGATLNATARVLLRAGAQSVDALTFSRVAVSA
jgi:ComF family protein